MNIVTQARRIPLTRTLRTFVQERIGGALQEFAHAIAAIRVELRDRNGRRGGGDKRCRIQVLMVAGAPVLVQEERANVRLAIHRAASRAACEVQSALRR